MKKEINILIKETIDILYQMLLLINEIYLTDSTCTFGEYITQKITIEHQLEYYLQS